MNGTLLLLAAVSMLAMVALCTATQQLHERGLFDPAVVPQQPPQHECLGEDDCKVMMLRRQVKSLASVSADARRRAAPAVCEASRRLVGRPSRRIERAALTRKYVAWLVRAANDCASPVPPFTRLYAPWSAIHSGLHASSWNFFVDAVTRIHARAEDLVGVTLHHHESGIVVGTPGFVSETQCDSQFFDEETGRFEAQLTTQHRDYAAIMCLSPPEEPVHLRYCDGTAVHMTTGTMVLHECGGANCWSIDRVSSGRIYLLTCWFTRARKHSTPLPQKRSRRIKRVGNHGRSSWREVQI